MQNLHVDTHMLWAECAILYPNINFGPMVLMWLYKSSGMTYSDRMANNFPVTNPSVLAVYLSSDLANDLISHKAFTSATSALHIWTERPSCNLLSWHGVDTVAFQIGRMQLDCYVHLTLDIFNTLDLGNRAESRTSSTQASYDEVVFHSVINRKWSDSCLHVLKKHWCAYEQAPASFASRTVLWPILVFSGYSAELLFEYIKVR